MMFGLDAVEAGVETALGEACVLRACTLDCTECASSALGNAVGATAPQALSPVTLRKSRRFIYFPQDSRATLCCV